jgi:chemotaxis signal transduction protein
VSLYLQVGVGSGRYLLDAVGIVEIHPVVPGADAVHWRGTPAAVVDLREMFGEDAAGRECCVLCVQASGEVAALLVDRADGLVDLGNAEFRPLPPLGPLGSLIDAVAIRMIDERPMLRLRGDRALAIRAAQA